MDLLVSTFRNIRAHKLRFLLTSLGISWGALMLVYLSINMAGVERHFRTELEEVGPKVVMLWPGSILKNRVGERGAREVELDNDDVERLDALHSIEAIAPDIVMWSQIVRNGARTKLLPVNGGAPETLAIRNFEVAEGRFLTRTDVERSARVAFLGAAAAKRLFGRAPPIGGTIQIESISFRVIGTSVAKGDQLIGINGKDDLVVLIPYTTAQRHFVRGDEVEQVVFAPRTREGSFEAIQHARQVIGLHHDFHPDVETAISQMNLYEALKDIFAMIGALKIFLVSAGVITLLVGAIGVMNIMLVVVGERTREIGLRKAVGATSRAVFVQFLCEAAAISTLSGITGAALGLGLSRVMMRLVPPESPIGSPPVYDPFTLVTIVVALILVGVVAGVAPAVRASRVPPAEALRGT